MVSCLILAAALAGSSPDVCATNETRVTEARERIRRRRKKKEEMSNVESWHCFSSGKKVQFDKDLRPDPYEKEKPSPHDRKPRKPQKKERAK